MATEAHILDDGELASPVPNGAKYSIGIVVAEWNSTITKALLDGAVATLKKHGAGRISVMQVPGTFELTAGCARMLNSDECHAVIAIGCVIRGDTPHFDYVCQGATVGIATLNAHLGFFEKNRPVVFCVLTTENREQAFDRAGGRLGNKGSEAAEAALKMCAPYTYVVK